MDIELIEHICTQVFSYTDCCCYIYKNSTLHRTISTGYMDDPLLSEFQRHSSLIRFQTDRDIAIFSMESVILLGRMRCLNSDYTLMVGPIVSEEPSAQDIRHLMSCYHVPSELYDAVTTHIHSIPVMLIERFLSLLSLLYMSINHQIITYAEIVNNSEIDASLLLSLNQQANAIASEARSTLPSAHFAHEYDEKLIYYIQNGMVSDMAEFQSKSFQGPVRKLGSNYLRSVKNTLLSLNTLCIRAAINGGVDYETAYALGALYAQRIENCQTIEALTPLSQTIRMDYCKRVHEIQQPKVDNPLLVKAMRYISEHLYEKIRAGQIAEHLGISPEYLSVIFKESFSCSIPAYVSGQKVAEAKKLLRFTQKSLAEISDMLAYSSQSYFQNQFRRACGITPAEYRKNIQK